MQADAIWDKASLNVKCYKRLYHTILWQRDGNSCCIFSHSIQKEKKNMYPFPKPFTWPKMMAHALSTQQHHHVPWQTMLDHIKTVSWHSPHAGGIPSPILGIIPEIYYSTHHETQYLFLLAIVHGTWISFPGPGIKPATPLDAQSLNCWTTKEAQLLWQRWLCQAFPYSSSLGRGSETSWLNNKGYPAEGKTFCLRFGWYPTRGHKSHSSEAGQAHMLLL